MPLEMSSLEALLTAGVKNDVALGSHVDQVPFATGDVVADVP